MRNLFTAAAAALVLAVSAPAAAADLVVTNGVLTGANGVNVNGTLYDVTFIDGTCIGLFSGCDANNDFALSSSNIVSATDALANLYHTTAAATFDADASLTRGCVVPNVPFQFCNILVPYAVNSTDVTFRGFQNYSSPNTQQGTDTFIGGTLARTLDTTPGAGTYAVFRLSAVAPVPEPATWAMMLVGFGSIGFAMRRQRKPLHQIA